MKTLCSFFCVLSLIFSLPLWCLWVLASHFCSSLFPLLPYLMSASCFFLASPLFSSVVSWCECMGACIARLLGHLGRRAGLGFSHRFWLSCLCESTTWCLYVMMIMQTELKNGGMDRWVQWWLAEVGVQGCIFKSILIVLCARNWGSMLVCKESKQSGQRSEQRREEEKGVMIDYFVSCFVILVYDVMCPPCCVALFCCLLFRLADEGYLLGACHCPHCLPSSFRITAAHSLQSLNMNLHHHDSDKQAMRRWSVVLSSCSLTSDKLFFSFICGYILHMLWSDLGRSLWNFLHVSVFADLPALFPSALWLCLLVRFLHHPLPALHAWPCSISFFFAVFLLLILWSTSCYHCPDNNKQSCLILQRCNSSLVHKRLRRRGQERGRSRQEGRTKECEECQHFPASPNFFSVHRVRFFSILMNKTIERERNESVLTLFSRTPLSSASWFIAQFGLVFFFMRAEPTQFVCEVT